MRSRMVREGSVGLLIIAGAALFTWIILWLRGISLGQQSYRVIFDFDTVAGLQTGTPVRFRGVQVGRVVATRPGSKGVEVEAEISPPDLQIPKQVLVEANQSGLLGAIAVDLTPVAGKDVPATITTKPLDKNCDREQILCHQDHVSASIGVSIDQLIRNSVKFTELYGNPKFFDNVNALAKNSAEAASEVTKLTKEFAELTRIAKSEVGTFTSSAQAVGDAAIAAKATAGQFSATAAQFGGTADQLSELIAANRSTLVDTLNNISGLTSDLRVTMNRIDPLVDRVAQGELIRNLETLSANAAQASANFRDLSQSLNSPTNLTMLQQTLDSARATFQNMQKISSDLDDLTGDPTFRANIKNLVNGLSGLVSSTEQLQRQAQLAQVLSEMTPTVAAVESSPQPSPPAVPPPTSETNNPSAR